MVGAVALAAAAAAAARDATAVVAAAADDCVVIDAVAVDVTKISSFDLVFSMFFGMCACFVHPT